MRAACERLGRPFAEEDLVQTLKNNWYGTAGELAAMPDETARSLGVPLRLRSVVAEMMSAAGQPLPGGGPSDFGSQQTTLAAEAAQEAAAWEAAGAEAGRALQQAPATISSTGSASSRATSSGSSQTSIRSQAGVPQALVGPAEGDRGAGFALADQHQHQHQEQQQQREGEQGQPSASTAGVPLAEVAGALASGAATADMAAAYLATAAADVDYLHLPIEERRCPPWERFGNALADAPKLSKRLKGVPYALAESEMSESLRAECAEYHRFLTVRFFGAQAEPISDVTARKYADHMRGALGYLHRVRGVPLQDLSFSQLLPSATREGVALVFEYVLWLAEERDISVRTESIVLRATSAAAKFLYHGQSNVNPGRGEKAYSDLEIVKELRGMTNLANKRAKVAPRTADEELKWLSWPEYLWLCEELRKECAALRPNGKSRKATGVAKSLQRYLIFAILSCVPDRQRTLRELEVGRTLVKDKEGRWVIRHGPGDYKTGRTYGERPALVISPRLYPELEAYMNTWRATMEPTHDLLFCQQNGQPLTEKSLYKMFWATSFRLTGKRTNPHLVRDMIVTHLRGSSSASERELEALAIYMGHSVEMQRDTYDRRTKAQKVEPAVELLATLNAGSRSRPASSGASSGSDADA